jgi:maltose alpha-D-glucosyltransferase/alpha-amylase
MQNMERHWYKEAVFYTLDVRSFKDGNGDGIGDFQGLLNNFDYIVDLGVNCLWVLPFFNSQGRDFGYDVTDHCSVDPELGTMEDFMRLVKKASDNNIKIIIDLIANHTSDKHPWFLEAQKGKDSPYYDYYIWSKKKPKQDKKDVIFKNVESSNWAHDKTLDEYYYHTFYSFQPDLNLTNPAVQKEIIQIIKFWMERGISGFRVDAVPHLLSEKGKTKFKKDPFDILRTWKETICRHNKEGVMTGECDVHPKDYGRYIKSNRLDGISNFYCNNYFFYSLAIEDPKPLAKAYQKMPETNASQFYINFLRNHDELDLERLTDEERQKVYKLFAPEDIMRIYGRGIRRRLPPMLHNNRMLLELCFSLLFSLPGTPILRYGEEIGMGDDLRLTQRNSVRTGMQWRNEKNGGFSVELPSKQVWPVISGGEFGYEKINVVQQQNDPSSLLNTVKQMIHGRQKATAFGYCHFEFLETSHKQVMAHCCQYEGQLAMAVHSFSEESLVVQIETGRFSKELPELLLGDCVFSSKGDNMEVKLGPYGYAWWVGRELQAKEF